MPLQSGREDGAAEPASRDGFHRHLRHRDHLSGLPVLQNETAQLGPGSPEVHSIVARGRDIWIGRARMAPKMAGHVVLDPDWIMLMLPLGWGETYVFNGCVARPHDLFLSSSRDGYAATGDRRDLLGVGVYRDRLSAALRALSGRSQDEFALHDRRISLGAEAGGRLRRWLRAAIDGARGAPLGAGPFMLSEAVESEVICGIAGTLLSHIEAGAPTNSLRADPRRVVRAARRAFERKRPECMTLADLCNAAGVGQAWLHRCFIEVYGVSPMAYHRARRLREARARILDPNTPPRSIKDVSLSLGFVNGGRFASDDRALSGGSPSETLRDGRA